MGCTTSSQNTTGYKDQNSEKRQAAGGKSENDNVARAVENVTRTDKTASVKKANVDKALRSDSSINLQQEFHEGLAPGKKENSIQTHEPDSLHEISNSKTQKKSKKLNQVMAWGKRRTTTENNFLEDLRLHRETATASDSRYEKEYETTGADETSRFIEGANSDDESSMSDLMNDLSHHKVEHRRVEHEESFDASKIIDVEKFRAANATEKINKISNSDQDNGVLFRRDPDFNIETKSSKEFHKLNSSLQDLTMDNKEEYLNNLYNEDDENLIESIEREFLLTHDNFLPGQIIN